MTSVFNVKFTTHDLNPLSYLMIEEKKIALQAIY